MSQVAADLRAAAEVLRRDGWVQGDYESAGRHCVAGAIYAVTNGSGVYMSDRYLSAKVALMRQVGRPVVRFNDAPGRSADEVIAALLAAADAAEAQP